MPPEHEDRRARGVGEPTAMGSSRLKSSRLRTTGPSGGLSAFQTMCWWGWPLAIPGGTVTSDYGRTWSHPRRSEKSRLAACSPEPAQWKPTGPAAPLTSGKRTWELPCWCPCATVTKSPDLGTSAAHMMSSGREAGSPAWVSLGDCQGVGRAGSSGRLLGNLFFAFAASGGAAVPASRPHPLGFRCDNVTPAFVGMSLSLTLSLPLHFCEDLGVATRPTR